MKKNTTRDTNGVLGEAHEVGCTLKVFGVEYKNKFKNYNRMYQE